ncbi:MAG: type II secretion system GspH family protein [Pseudomonadales bacterium]|nr:type II secretion system GspH family protein [Pseudomonadales bacterium]
MTKSRSQESGATLVELIITIVILSVALLAVVSVYSRAISSSANPIIYAKSIELGQAFLDEILTKKFDHNTPLGGIPATTVFTASGSFGPETGESSRALYNDVDDFHGASYSTVELITGDNDAVNQYVNYQVDIAVSYIDTANDSTLRTTASLTTQSMKRITVTVSNPLSQPLTFTAYKGNF